MGYIFPPPQGVNSLKSSKMFEQRLLYKQKSFSRLFDLTPLDTIRQCGSILLQGDVYPRVYRSGPQYQGHPLRERDKDRSPEHIRCSHY